MENVVSFDAEKVSRYLERAIPLFLGDPPDSDYQRGYMAAMMDVYREGLGKGANDDRLKLLDAMLRENSDGTATD